jgi:GntR family transcriptional regulator/MocR family aminotransferase
MAKPLRLEIDRSAKTPLAEQIRKGIAGAIESGVLKPGARLPSWVDLAAQLGVARGTVRAAYERLTAAQLIVAAGANGTRVADRPAKARRTEDPVKPGSFMEQYQEMTAGPLIFQMGVPSQEIFPAKLFSRIRSFAVRAESAAPALYPDPRGELALRREIAAYLAIARGIECSPSQVIVTSGYAGGLGLALRALGLEGRKVWMENPGFPFTRHGLTLAGLSLRLIPVDEDGIDVEHGIKTAPDAALVVVTPGQQAPLGPTLSLTRRLRLLDWAAQAGAWIIEDDYLSELQLEGRAAPALASLDRAGRVLHLGTFSKTISPSLRLGFLVAPPVLAPRLAEVAACLAPPPGPALQQATAEFMREGHYMRHLRRTKRHAAAQRDALLQCLRGNVEPIRISGLSALMQLPDEVSDVAVAREMQKVGLAPTALSVWYGSASTAKPGLVLGIATAPVKQMAGACNRLLKVLNRF